MDNGLRDVLREAQANGSAVGHFNVSDVAILKAVVGAAKDMKAAVIVGDIGAVIEGDPASISPLERSSNWGDAIFPQYKRRASCADIPPRACAAIQRSRI